MRILLVEDDPELGPLVAARLRAAGFAVDLVGTGAGAELAAAVTAYDCIVADRGLPDGDGLDLVRDLRSRGSAVPILMLTALGALDDRLEGFETGADDYLVKPFAAEELIVRVRALTRRVAPNRPAIVHIGDVQIDLPRRRVLRAGVLLALTAKEFAVLDVLAEHGGDVVTRTELIERCWDEMSEPMSNVVDVLIGQLRRLLGEPDPIETVRGFGYRLRGEAR